jgi:hypothetical protein
MKKFQLIFLFLIFIFFSLYAGDKGDLENFEDELNKPVEHYNGNNHEPADDDEEEEDSLFEVLFRAIVYEVFIGSEPFYPKYEIQPFIYSDDCGGRYGETGSSFDFEFASSYLYSSGKLDGISVESSFFFARMMSLKFYYQKFWEDIDSGHDKMELVDFKVDYYRFRDPVINWFWGVGLKGLRRNSDYLGFGLNTGWEIYPFKPISIEFEASINWLNEHPVSQLNAEIGLHFWRMKLNTGYQRLQTGSAKINAFTIGLGINF